MGGYGVCFGRGRRVGLAERGCPGVQSGERGLTRREDRPKVDA